MGTQGQGHVDAEGRKRTRAAAVRQVKFAIVLILMVFVAVVLAYNRDPATFHFLGKHPTFPLCVWLLIAFGAGAVAGGIAVHLLCRKK